MDKQLPTVAVIPAFNEERTIAKVILLTKKYVDKVLVCDDGSTDLTAKIAKELGATVIRHKRNMGKGATIRTALSHVKQLRPRAVVFLDGDGQHNPEEITKLLEPIKDGKADVVIGSRYLNKAPMEAPLYRRAGLKLINALNRKATNGVIRDTQNGFRAYSSKALDVIQQCIVNGYGIETEQIAMAFKNGLRVTEVPVMVHYKQLENTSKKNPLRHGAELVEIALRLMVEDRPLLVLGVPGAILTMIGMGAGLNLLWIFNMSRYFSIPTALIALGAMTLGAIFFITSIMLYAVSRMTQALSNKIKLSDTQNTK